jgi:hypothetical protein
VARLIVVDQILLAERHAEHGCITWVAMSWRSARPLHRPAALPSGSAPTSDVIVPP